MPPLAPEVALVATIVQIVVSSSHSRLVKVTPMGIRGDLSQRYVPEFELLVYTHLLFQCHLTNAQGEQCKFIHFAPGSSKSPSASPPSMSTPALPPIPLTLP